MANKLELTWYGKDELIRTDPRSFSQFLQALRYIYEHPIILEKNPSRVVEDAG